MADEPRRSGRATKGQHTKDVEPTDEAGSKKKGKGKGKGSKAKEVEEVEEEKEDVVRCICGMYEEEEDEPRAMICCDNCEVWQHNQCMGLPEDYEVDVYFCEQCKPEQHQDLLDAIERGEKPWEEAQTKRLAAKAAKGKKGKKGGRKSAASVPVEEKEPEEPVAKPASGQKRKAEETPVPEIKNKKVRGTPAAENGTRATSQSRTASTPARQPSRSESSAGLVAADPKELKNSVRKGAANSLIKIFGDVIKDAVKKGTYKLPGGSNAADYGLQLGLQVEHFLNHVQTPGVDEPGDAYKNQLRAISFNVKKNAELALRVINAEISPAELATMDPKEFASEEQQRKDAALVKEMEKQHEIVQEEGPRIRRTHKGDEYVDEAHAVAPESATSRAPTRKQSTVDQDVEMKSPDAGVKAKRPLSVNTNARARPTDPRRKSSTNFDFDKVWSGVKGSPGADGSPRFPEVQQRGSPPPQGQAQGTDPDIDNLLKDEENESEPYSPKEFTNDDGLVWQGLVNGGSLGRFRTSAKFAAGATPDAHTLRMTWDEVIPAEIAIHGRIQPQKADEYLCGLEYSSTSDLIVVTMAEPRDATNLAGFDKFFSYLKTKQRYGVGVQHRNPAIKDIYLLPMDSGQTLPTFMKALENDFPDPVQERMLLVPIVIKNSELPHNLNKDGQPMIMSPSIGGPVAQTPITPQDGQRDMPQQFPIPYPYAQVSQPSMNGGSTPQVSGSPAPPQASMSHPAAHHPAQQTAATPTPQNQAEVSKAMSSAMRILGPQLAAAPAIQNLCRQAPGSGDEEMSIVRECIEQNAMAAQDLGLLTVLLHAKSQSRQQTDGHASGEQHTATNGASGESGPGPAVLEPVVPTVNASDVTQQP